MRSAAVGSSLSLHVLDAARGQAGAGLGFSLRLILGPDRQAILAEDKTDEAGRWAWASAQPLEAGIYEFIFAAEAYQARFGALPHSAHSLAVRLQHLPGRLMRPAAGLETDEAGS